MGHAGAALNAFPIKTSLCLQHRVLLPGPKIQEMKVHLSFKSPFLLGISAPLVEECR